MGMVPEMIKRLKRLNLGENKRQESLEDLAGDSEESHLLPSRKFRVKTSVPAVQRFH